MKKYNWNIVEENGWRFESDGEFCKKILEFFYDRCIWMHGVLLPHSLYYDCYFPRKKQAPLRISGIRDRGDDFVVPLLRNWYDLAYATPERREKGKILSGITSFCDDSVRHRVFGDRSVWRIFSVVNAIHFLAKDFETFIDMPVLYNKSERFVGLYKSERFVRLPLIKRIFEIIPSLTVQRQ